jgi:hypothetical protein
VKDDQTMPELSKRIADTISNSVDEGFTLFDTIEQQAEAQAKAEPEGFDADVILQIVWGKLNERFMSSGWTAAELAAPTIREGFTHKPSKHAAAKRKPKAKKMGNGCPWPPNHLEGMPR